MKDRLKARAKLLIAEAMLKSARFRTESRGPFYRRDLLKPYCQKMELLRKKEVEGCTRRE